MFTDLQGQNSSSGHSPNQHLNSSLALVFSSLQSCAKIDNGLICFQWNSCLRKLLKL